MSLLPGDGRPQVGHRATQFLDQGVEVSVIRPEFRDLASKPVVFAPEPRDVVRQPRVVGAEGFGVFVRDCRGRHGR